MALSSILPALSVAAGDDARRDKERKEKGEEQKEKEKEEKEQEEAGQTKPTAGSLRSAIGPRRNTFKCTEGILQACRDCGILGHTTRRQPRPAR